MTSDLSGGAASGEEPDIRAQVRMGAMSAFQVLAVTICMIINMLDGFDVLAIAFTGPKIAKLWALDPTQLGLLFSSGLAGMMAGSLVLSPLADIIGRRATVLFGLALITAGMVASGYAQDLMQLVVLRAATGLGIGTLLSSINTIVVEYSSQKRREFAVSFMAIGYPIGGTIGGVIAIYLIQNYGWPAVYWFGGTVSAALIPVVLVALPESLDFLLLKRPRNALTRINTLLRLMGRPAIAALPALPSARDKPTVLSALDKTFLMRTLTISVAYFLVVMSFYFMLNWTPKVLVDQGLSLATGISGSIFMSIGGIAGGLIFGWFARWFGLIRLASVYMFLGGCVVAAFGFSGVDLPLLMTLAVLAGFFINGAICALYAIVGAAFPVQIRNTGTGLVIGLGRIGGIIGPYLGGILIAGGWSKPEYCLALAVPSALAALVILFVSLREPAPAMARAAA